MNCSLLSWSGAGTPTRRVTARPRKTVVVAVGDGGEHGRAEGRDGKIRKDGHFLTAGRWQPLSRGVVLLAEDGHF